MRGTATTICPLTGISREPKKMDRKILAEKILEARQRRGLTQIETAGAAGISQSYYAEIETGRKMPTIATLDRIAAALKIRPGKLLD